MAGQPTYRFKRKSIGSGEYKILVDGEVRHFNHWDDIPLMLERVISFKPHIPPGPHTPEQHREIESFTEKFMSIMKRENYAGSD